MKNFYKKIKAFTLSEVMVVFVIVAVVASATFAITKSQLNYATKYQYYSAFVNLKQAVGELIANGTAGAKTLPATGATFCSNLIAIMNTVGTPACGTNVTSGFTDLNANFITTNGMRYYNFGTDPVASVYTVYVDINGASGKSDTNDVITFTINRNGTVLPDPASKGATDKNYLSASVRYWNATDYAWTENRKEYTYQEAVCKAGEVTGAYCGAIAQDANCTVANPCEVIINKPGY